MTNFHWLIINRNLIWCNILPLIVLKMENAKMGFAICDSDTNQQKKCHLCDLDTNPIFDFLMRHE